MGAVRGADMGVERGVDRGTDSWAERGTEGWSLVISGCAVSTAAAASEAKSKAPN